MEQCDTLIEARWCVPVEPAEPVLESHAVAIRDGRIVALLPACDARRRFDPGVLVNRPDHVLMPGLVNAHTHAAMTLLRGYADDLPLERWLKEGVWPAERRWVSSEMVRDGTRHAIVEMLRSGITCFGDQYFFPATVAETAADMNMRAVIGTPVIDFETAWAASGEACVQKGADLVHDPWADHPLISSCFAPHSVEVVSDATFRVLRVVADQLDLRIQIHLHESRAEIDAALAASGERPLARLDRLGLVNASLVAIHGVHLDDAEMARLAEVGASVVHCPHSNLKLASGFARVHDLENAGVNVGLGTDGAASNNTLDMLAELRTASLLAKCVAGDAAAKTASQSLRMATLDSARALGLDDLVGSITPGKAADLICIDLARPRSQPVYDPVSQVVYTSSSEQVSDVWVAGRQLLERGHLAAADETEILQRSSEWQRRIAAR